MPWRARGGRKEAFCQGCQGGGPTECRLHHRRAWRRGSCHHDIVPFRSLPQVRTLSTPTSFCGINPAQSCPGRLRSRAPLSSLWRHHAGPMHRRPCRPVTVSCPIIDGRSRLDHRIPFHFIKSEPQIQDSTTQNYPGFSKF
jgi:hypothetical protein